MDAMDNDIAPLFYPQAGSCACAWSLQFINRPSEGLRGNAGWRRLGLQESANKPQLWIE
jgi:hypothetical protein